MAWLAGYSVRQQRAQAAARREQAELRAREQLAEARRARSEERLQISRELHDVMAHTLSLIAVQAGVASYVIGDAPRGSGPRPVVHRADQPQRAARDAGAVRGAPGRGDRGQERRRAGQRGTPCWCQRRGWRTWTRLAERTGKAGVRVELSVRGERPRLPAGLDLAAYRVIQEAVTNVIKHAATDRCQVTVGYQEDTLTLEVTDDGSGSAAERRRASGRRQRHHRNAGAGRDVRRGGPGRAAAGARLPGHRLVPARGPGPPVRSRATAVDARA